MVRGLRGSAFAEKELEAVKSFWEETLGAIGWKRGSSLDILTNGWLLYQTLSCRLWARNGYYQSGGAFGFRDSCRMSWRLFYARTPLVRQHLLLCAGRHTRREMFSTGGIHYGPWGAHTMFDDFLWLPLATARYIDFSGDTDVLQESIKLS